MAMGIENPVHLLFIAAVALIVLGPKRLPEVARALGHGIREFREAISQPAMTYAQPPVAGESPAAHEPAGQPESVDPT
jgi:sec-independent protein translocase protein TatA